MIALPDDRSLAAARSFLGHPRGLFFLAFTEAWERFSYYGMTGLVVLYMVNELLLPGHIEHIAGIGGLRAALESAFGPLSTQAFASQIFGLYSSLVYFTPLLGGAIADRWIGQRNAVVIGALSLSAGQFLVGSERTFLVALLLLVVGSGFLKGNIAAQVGGLYPEEDEARRTRGFIIFSTGINIGAITGPIVCGLLAELYGWRLGFGAAALLMLAGLITYLSGYRYLPARVERPRAARTAPEAASAGERRIIAALIVVLVISVLTSIANYQIFNVLPVWIQQHVRPAVAGFRIPIPWYQSIDPLVSVAAVPLVFWIWGLQARRGREPGDLAKIATGSWLAALSNLIPAAASLAPADVRVSPWWPLLYVAVLGLSFLYYWPTLLALVSRAAPPRVNATLMGTTYLSLFVSNYLIGWIGSFYERLGPAAFWTVHAVIAAAGGLAIVLFGGRLERALQPAVSAAPAGAAPASGSA